MRNLREAHHLRRRIHSPCERSEFSRSFNIHQNSNCTSKKKKKKSPNTQAHKTPQPSNIPNERVFFISHLIPRFQLRPVHTSPMRNRCCSRATLPNEGLIHRGANPHYRTPSRRQPVIHAGQKRGEDFSQAGGRIIFEVAASK